MTATLDLQLCHRSCAIPHSSFLVFVTLPTAVEDPLAALAPHHPANVDLIAFEDWV